MKHAFFTTIENVDYRRKNKYSTKISQLYHFKNPHLVSRKNIPFGGLKLKKSFPH